jgi:hypothetical protein
MRAHTQPRAGQRDRKRSAHAATALRAR